jgi:hypothetical protein
MPRKLAGLNEDDRRTLREDDRKTGEEDAKGG